MGYETDRRETEYLIRIETTINWVVKAIKTIYRLKIDWIW